MSKSPHSPHEFDGPDIKQIPNSGSPAQSTEPALTIQQGLHPWSLRKKILFMFLSLGAGVLCGLGQHLFYNNLDGKPAPDSSWNVLHGLSKQKVNIAIGNTLAFFTKAFLAIAVAIAHDQVSWRTIQSRPRELGLVDALFASKGDWISALNGRMWFHMPFPTILLLVFWLLSLAPLITPSALTIKAGWLNTTESTHVPRVDFTSMNFATVSWAFTDILRALDDTEWQQSQLDYVKPQYSVQKSVQGSLITSSILSISPLSQNSSWHLDFHGPAIECTSLTDNTKGGLRNRIFTQWAKAWNVGALGPWMSYFSWLPSGTGVNASLPLTAGVNDTYTPRLTIAGGDPLSLYIMVLPKDTPPNPHLNITIDQITDYMQNTTSLWQIKLQNVTYSANFSYPNGVQEVKLQTSDPINEVNYLSGFHTFVATSKKTYDPKLTQITLNRSAVETFAYQSIMDAFTSMLVGNITITESEVEDTNVTQTQLDIRSSIAMTPLIQAKEMADISQALAAENSNLGNVVWNGKSVDLDETTSLSVSNLIEEMFRNATISLMNQAALHPNYSSPYAPSKVSIQRWTTRSVYSYSTSTLWITYGTAIALSFLCVSVGTLVVLRSQAAYTNQFSTFLRVAQNVHMADGVAPQDTSGKDPLPTYLKRMVTGFPQDYRSLSEQKVEFQSGGGRQGGVDDIQVLENESDERQ